jgi:uncharacterized membrane protein
MTTLARSILIKAPLEAIETITNDARRMPEWFAGVIASEPDSRYPEPGGQLKMIYRAAGFEFHITQTNLSWEPGLGGINRMDGPFRGTSQITYRVEEEGTRVILRLDYEVPGRGAGRVFDRLLVERRNARNLEESLRNLKRLVEQEIAFA